MRKKVFFLMAIVLFMPFQLFSQISREDAFNIVKTQVFANDFSDYEISALPNVLQPYTSIETTDSVVLSPNITSWFFCADNNPIRSIYQNSHCKFIFVDAFTGNTITKNDCAMIIDTTLLFLKGASDYDTNFIFNVPVTHTQNPRVFKHNYAIIINGGGTRLLNSWWYWNNCSLIFKILVNKYNYDKDKVYVLMADGTDPGIDMLSPRPGPRYISTPLDLDGDGINDVRYSARKAVISAIFDTLARKITPADNVFIYVTDHGGEGSTIETWNSLDTVRMHDPNYPPECFTKNEFMDEINKLSLAKTINIVMSQCYSGGYASSINNNKTVVSTACNGYEEAMYHGKMTYMEFTYHWACAVLGYTPNQTIIDADSNHDGCVSMLEAFKYAKPLTIGNHVQPQYNGSTSALGSFLTLEGSYGQMSNYPYDYDLYISDNPSDNGVGVSNNAGNSPDIWVRHFNDGVTVHQDPLRGDTNYVYVRIHNNGSSKSPGIIDTLNIYIKNTGRNTNYGQWPTNWDLVSSIIIPPIKPNGDTILHVKTYFPSDFLWPNYTILTRISSYFDTLREGFLTMDNILNNNNISTKNVVTTKMNYTTFTQQSIAQIASNVNSNFVGSRLRFRCQSPELEMPLTNEAEINLVLSEDLVNSLMDNVVLSGMSRVNDSTFIITSSSAYIEGLSILDLQDPTVKINVNFLTRYSTEKKIFNYDVLLEDDENLVGSLTIQVEKPERENFFQANAGADLIIIQNADVQFEAEDIMEDAVYKWYSMDNLLLHTGRIFDTNLSAPGQFVLEVTSMNDGFKDYDMVEVVLNPNTISAISPNPSTSGYVNVYFELGDNVTEAKLMVFSSSNLTMQGIYPINNFETYKTIDLTSYNNGSYVVVLVCDGINSDSKIFVKQ